MHKIPSLFDYREKYHQLPNCIITPLMKKIHSAIKAVIILALIASVGCSSQKDNKAWQAGTKTNTVESYKKYLADFPTGKHVSEAHDSIQGLYLKQVLQGGDLYVTFDTLIGQYPETKYAPLFDSLIYNDAKQKNTPEAFEKYAERFPNGARLNEIETVLFNGILEGTSTLNFKDYLDRYPNGKHIAEAEKSLSDSVRIRKSVNSVERYLLMFPEGPNAEAITEQSEEIYFKEAMARNTLSDMNKFLEKFPETTHKKLLNIRSDPAGAAVSITDRRGTVIGNRTTPDTLTTLEGANLTMEFTKAGFNTDNRTYVVTASDNQTVSGNLKSDITYLASDNFEGASSGWDGNGLKFKFGTGDGQNLLAECSATQYQHTRNFNIDFSKDFTLEMKVKQTGEASPNKSYVGFVWGSSQKVRYFFITPEGKYSFGEQDDRSRTGDNEYGYTKWNPHSGGQDTWPAAGGFSRGEYNTLTVQKKGNVVFYKINGATLYQENLMSVTAGRMVGIGIGNTRALIDYIRIAQ
jgi:hypothetical protein